MYLADTDLWSSSWGGSEWRLPLKDSLVISHKTESHQAPIKNRLVFQRRMLTQHRVNFSSSPAAEHYGCEWLLRCACREGAESYWTAPLISKAQLRSSKSDKSHKARRISSPSPSMFLHIKHAHLFSERDAHTHASTLKPLVGPFNLEFVLELRCGCGFKLPLHIYIHTGLPSISPSFFGRLALHLHKKYLNLNGRFL